VVKQVWPCSRRGPAVGRSGPSPLLTVLAVAVLSVLLGACSNLGPDTSTAAEAAAAFHRAIGDGDGGAACGLLAPVTVKELESSSGQSCTEAILGENLPTGPGVQGSQAFGRAAQVQLEDDVVFLSIFGDHWLITAAGCRSRDDRPYDCTLQGG
jgi:hypothetical protein